MAEPYDTVNAVGSGPKYWWRMQGTSALNIPNEGSGGIVSLREELGSGGTKALTYQYDSGPLGEGSHGVHLQSTNRQAGLESNDILSLTAKGAIFMVVKPTSASWNWDNQCAGISDNAFDSDMITITPFNGASKRLYLEVQNINSTQEYWDKATNGHNIQNGVVATIGFQAPTSDPGTWEAFVDGSEVTMTHGGDSSPDTPDNWWGDNFTGERMHFGYRNGVTASAQSIYDMVIYEFLIFDERLTADDYLTLHNALGGIGPFESKTIRRTGRRLFSANTP